MLFFTIALGLLYFIPGVTKLTKPKQLTTQFAEFGLSQKTMMGVGFAEVAAGIGMQLSGLRTIAAVGMSLMMVGAIYHHRKANHPTSATGPAMVVLAASLIFLAVN